MKIDPHKPLLLYPTKNSLGHAITSATARLPITTHNELVGVLMTYHNSLLAAQAKESPDGTVDHE